MKKLTIIPIFLFLLTILSCSSKPAKSKILSETDFTAKINRALIQEFPEENFTIESSLKIVSGEPNNSHSYFLDNLYSAYKMDTSRLNEIIDGYLKTVHDLFRYAPVNITNIVPTIKPKEYLDE